MSRGTLEAMREVRVMEDDSSDEGRRGMRRRRTEMDVIVGPPPLAPPPTSIRHDHSPDSVIRRRSRSIGFRRDQIKHHDVSESHHERPGAEANIAGRYLINHRGERFARRDDDESSVGDYTLRKSKTEVVDRYGAEVERRRREGRQKEVDSHYDEEYERRGPYPPQRDRPRYRHDDGDEDKYSDYYDEKRTSRKYR
jgi:hypothetical protein